MSPFSLDDSPPPPMHDDHPLQLKIDYSSKGLSHVRPFPTQRRSPWVQGGNATRVLSGLARTNRRRLKRWEDEGFDSGTGPNGVSPRIEDDGRSQGWRTASGSSSSASSTVGGVRRNGELDEDDDEDEDEQDNVDVYYQIFVGPDHAAIRTFHSDRARYHDLFNNGFPYLQTHLAFLDDLQYSGLWTITEIPSISPLPTLSNPFAGGGIADDESALLTTSDNLASSSLLGSPADGPSRSDSMEQERRGRISPGRLSSSYSEPDSLNGSAADLGQDLQAGSQPEVVPPINLREYWKSHVFPLRHDDLSTLGPSEVRFKITESLHRDGRSSAIKDSGPSSTRPSTSAPSRPSRLARELTEEMLDGPQSPVDDFKDGKTPMNHGSEQSKEFPFDGRSEGTETPVNRSRSPMGRSDRQDEKVEGKEMWNRAYYIKAVEVLIALAELVKELQERRLCIAICRPEVFAVKPSSGAGSSTPVSLALHTMSHLKPISNYDHGRRIDKKAYELNLGSTPASANAFPRGTQSSHENDDLNSEDHPIDQAYVEDGGIVRREIGLEEDIFDEATIQLHLAYIAPETVSEPDFAWGPADVYSWGSCAYDLLTDGLADFLTPSEEPADLLRNVHDHSTRKRTPLSEKIKDCPLAISGLIDKTFNLDADIRYAGMAPLLCDLREIRQVLCQGQLPDETKIGRVDALSRFTTPTSLLERQVQNDAINKSFSDMSNNGIIKTLCFYGESGTGKSKQVETWCHERIRDRTAGGMDFLLGWAKMDQHQVKPLAGMVNIFEMLLAAIFSNPHENASVWKSLILDALPGLGSMFLDLLSPTWRDLLLGNRPEKDIDAVDWDTYSQRFKIWARSLFSLFAAAGRPLVIVIDDWQWMEATEKELWTELFENKPLDNTLVLITYRIESGQPLDMSPLKQVECIESLPFSLETIEQILVNGFHLKENKPEDGFNVLSSFLYNATKGNPLFLKFLLTRLIKDDVVCFDYDLEAWRVVTEMLPCYSTSGIEEFARWTLSRLGVDIQSVLKILSCLPAQGASLDLVARLFSKTSVITHASFEKARLFGIVRITEGIVAFSHDRHQEAARGLIAEKERSRFLANMARKLEAEGPDMIFVRADLLADAMPVEDLDWSSSEISNLMLDAAQKSIRSAAFDSAARYLRSANESLPVLKAETWMTNRDHCQRICTLATAIAAGLRDIAFAFSAVAQAFDLALTTSDKIAAATLCVRLHLLDYNLEGVFGEVDRIFPLIGMNLPVQEHIQNPTAKWVQKCPRTSEELLSLVDASADQPGDDQVHATSIALAAFMVACGPTIYTRLSGRAVQWMDYATALILRSREALRHPASGYLLGVRSILFASERKYELAAVYMDLGMTVPWRDTPWQGSSEIPYKAIEFLRAKSISSIDFGGTWNAAALSNSTDILIYISAIELGALVLSGRSVPLMLERGQASLVQLKQDLPQAIRPFLASFAQLAMNLLDTQKNPLEMYRLDGDAMAWKDEAGMGTHGETIGVSFYSTALLNATLFSAPIAFAQDLAMKVKIHFDGWKGLIGHFETLNVLSWYLLAYDVEDDAILHEIHEAYAAFPLNADFQALRSVLFALQSLKKLRQKKMIWSDGLLHVEAAVKAVSMTSCHLATGWLCLNAARTFRGGANLSKRIWGGFALDANQAFLRCGAIALSRQVMAEFPESFNIAEPASSMPIDVVGPRRDRMPKVASPTTSSSDVTSNSGDTKRALFISDETTPGLSQRLNIEGILKSFLAFATEKDSKMLIKRVLGILIQITRADSGFLALQNPSTNKLHLRGGGLHSKILTYDLPVSDATNLCPSSVLLHAAHTRKPVDSTDLDQTPLLRDNYFNFPSAKHILAVPLFIQNQLAGVICMQGSLLRFSSSVKSHVELLATFAAIVLESHDMTASLEQSVRVRTTQLEQALTHRQTFISSITHELRTPLHSISGLTAIMENSSDLPEAQKENVAGIRSSAEDLQRIITDVLDLSKLENGSMQIETVSFDLRQVAEAALDSVANLAHAKDLEVLLDNTIGTDPSTHILGDPFRIKQCLLNLLGNAIRFTETGEIRLGWTLEPSPVGGQSLVFSVTDTGIGIPVESRQRLFQPFSQVDASIQRKWGGTGLGLSITFNLAQTMGGTAWCESVEGKGSTFYFSVIVQPDIQVKTPKVRQEVASHVLLVAPMARPTTLKLARNLEQMNARVTITTPGQVSRHIEGVTAVMLDSAYSDAVPFFKRLANERPDIKITFLAELTDKAALLTRLSDPKARVITKPIKVQAIYDFLHTSSSGSEGDPAAKRIKPVTVIDKDTARRHPLDILFVDDNPINRAVGLKVLKKFGYSFVAVATNGAEAVDAAENARYDLILMDLQMPVMDGHTAMTKILESEKAGKPQIVALTANADTTTRELCLQQGFHGFLGKPLVIRELDTVFEAAHQVKMANQST